MNGANFGWIELVLFHGIAIGIAVWQWMKMDRMLKATRAEREAKRRKAHEREDEEPHG